MNSITTAGIHIEVDCRFDADMSNLLYSEYIFTYHIQIRNENNFPVQLLSRHWIIIYGNGLHREVQGDGVVGVQPILSPNKSYAYESLCNLSTGIGKMYGTYTFMNLHTGKKFEATIPAFKMVYPFMLN